MNHICETLIRDYVNYITRTGFMIHSTRTLPIGGQWKTGFIGYDGDVQDPDGWPSSSIQLARRRIVLL
jgi:hypothetical protein